jgi:hypothetical protein
MVPLALSKTAFGKLAPSMGPLLTKEAVDAMSKDYTSVKDRDDALLTVSRCINGVLYQQVVAGHATKAQGTGSTDPGPKPANTTTATTSDGAYTLSTLEVYDAFVWEFNSPFLWRITKEDIVDLYRTNMRRNHCEVAVGTGLFLQEMSKIHARGGLQQQQQQQQQRVMLLDSNPNTLRVCQERLANASLSSTWTIDTEVYDVLKDYNDDGCGGSQQKDKYDSVAANFLLHCLHGGEATIRTAVSNIGRNLVHPTDGVFFGSTILGKELQPPKSQQEQSAVTISGSGQREPPAPPCQAAIETNALYNEWGIFGNADDSYESIGRVLNECFDHVNLWKVGYCAVWTAQKPREQ